MEGINEAQIITGVIKEEEEKCGEKLLIVPTNRNKYLLGHVVFFLLGFCHMIPLTFVSAANNFWFYKLRNISDLYESTENRTLLQKNFASSAWIAITGFSLASGIFNVIFSHRYKIKNRLILTLCIELLIFILFTISVKVDTDDYQVPFFVIMLIGIGCLAAASTVNITASLNLYPRFPPTYMKMCIVGQGCSGVIGDILNIVIVTSFKGDIIRATLLYFGFGAVIVAITLILNIVLSRTAFFQNCLESIPENTEKKVPSRKELMRIGYKIWYSLVLIVLLLTGAPHPAVTALVVSEQDSSSSSWANDYFSPVMTFLLADTGLLIGRMISSYAPFNILEKPFLLISVARTLVLVPFIWLCNAQPRHFLPVLFPHDYQYAIIMGLFFVLNGCMYNEAVLVIPMKVDKHEADVAYSLFGLVVNITQALSAPIGLFIVNIL